MCKASIAAGADGAIVEVHNQPEEALSDGEQSLYFDQFDKLLESCKAYCAIENKKFSLQNPFVESIKVQ